MPKFHNTPIPNYSSFLRLCGCSHAFEDDCRLKNWRSRQQKTWGILTGNWRTVWIQALLMSIFFRLLTNHEFSFYHFNFCCWKYFANFCAGAKSGKSAPSTNLNEPEARPTEYLQKCKFAVSIWISKPNSCSNLLPSAQMCFFVLSGKNELMATIGCWLPCFLV